MSDEEKKEEFASLLSVFERFLLSIDRNLEEWEVLEELMALRANHLVHHAMNGFDMTWEDMLELLHKDAQDLGEYERDQASIIRAAIDNLVDFAVVEEYQMAEDIMEAMEGADEQGMSEEEKEEMFLAINRRYNQTYAQTEDEDTLYAMMMAAGWIKMDPGIELMYMTMGDERVRPWHLQYEGFTAPKAFFPQWLIPPIEHQCRCYLVESGDGVAKIEDVQDRTYRAPEMPEWFNRTFKESVCKGGRIFSDEHPYFQVNPEHYMRLHSISERIKADIYNGKERF